MAVMRSKQSLVITLEGGAEIFIEKCFSICEEECNFSLLVSRGVDGQELQVNMNRLVAPASSQRSSGII